MAINLSDRVRDNNNEFWEDARDYFLKDFFESAYRGKKKNLIANWLKNSRSKTLLLRQIDTCHRPVFVSDSFLTRFMPDGFETSVVDISEDINADVEMNATHEAIVTSTDNLTSFLIATARKDIVLPKLWHNVRDHYYVMRLFFFNQ